METKFALIAVDIREQKENGTGYFEKKVEEARTKAYASCAAGLILGPAGVAACMAVAAGVVEGKVIPELKEEMRKF